MIVEKGSRFKTPIEALVSRFRRNEVSVAKVEPGTESEDVVDPFATLRGLREKAGIMDDLLQSNMVEQPPIGRMRFLVRNWVRSFVRVGEIEGLGNLHLAITESRLTGKRIIFTPAHLADVDHTAAVLLMAKAGRGLGIQDELVWMGGVNMLRRSNIRRFLRSEHLIYNVTPRDMNHLQTLLDKSQEYRFDDQQLKTLESIRETFIKMRGEARQRVTETCVKGKRPMVVYIEGGRSYDGFLKPPQKGFARYLPRDDSTIVVPYRLYGTREVNPPDKDPKILRREMLPFWKKLSISMKVGQPYLSSEGWKVWRARTEEGRAADEEEAGINPVEWFMANIADLDMSKVRPEDQLSYKRLMQRFPPKGFYVPSEVDGKRNPLLRAKYPDNKTYIIGRALLGFYMRMYHRLDVQFDPDMPKKGPALFYSSHGGNLTTIALMVGDPFYPQTLAPIKSESFKGLLTGKLLRAWGAFPVNRDGQDRETVYRMLDILQEGRTVCIAAEGTRSEDGVLQPLDSSFVSFALMCAKRGYPVIPIAEPGTYRALPKGTRIPIPRPYKINVIGGSTINLSPFISQKLTPEVKIAAAQYMQDQLAALLPPEQRPRPGTKPMRDREEYIKPKKKS